MEKRYYKEYSYRLGRDMEFVTYGTTGKLVVVFPSQNGRFFDYENFNMTDVCAPWVESGKIQLVCPDGIDLESWSNEWGDMHERLLMQERWFSYVNEEFLPSVRAKNGSEAAYGRAITTGCSMGATHAANFFFRRPDLYDTVIALSGAYDAYLFFKNTDDPLAYENSPVLGLRRKPRLAVVEKADALFPRQCARPAVNDTLLRIRGAVIDSPSFMLHSKTSHLSIYDKSKSKIILSQGVVSRPVLCVSNEPRHLFRARAKNRCFGECPSSSTKREIRFRAKR